MLANADGSGALLSPAAVPARVSLLLPTRRYYKWATHFSHWLKYPAVVGFIVQLCELDHGTKQVLTPLFSISMLIWFILMMRFWKQTEASTRHKWKQPNSQARVQIPDFLKPNRSKVEWNEEFKVYEHVYPQWKRLLKAGQQPTCSCR